jgi:hypothetical protein
MGKDRWDAILASTPLNATAGAVTSKGYQYTPDKLINQLEWDAPPQMVAVNKTHRRNPSFTDFTGLKYGRLTVLGMIKDTSASGNAGAQWVCRCACGKYVARRAKAVRKASPDDRCSICQHNAYLVRSASGDHARRRAESDKARKWQPNDAA